MDEEYMALAASRLIFDISMFLLRISLGLPTDDPVFREQHKSEL